MIMLPTDWNSVMPKPRVVPAGEPKRMPEVLDGLAKNGDEGNSAVEADVKKRAVKLCERFPIYR